MRVQVLVLVIACFLARSAAGQNDAQRDAIAKVRALENSWNQAEAIGDVRALDVILDGSMIYVDEDGAVLSKAQFLDRMTQRNATVVQWLVTPTMDVHLYGDIAVVVGNYRVKGVRGGKPHGWTGRFIDTWVFRNGMWRCVAAQATPILH